MHQAYVIRVGGIGSLRKKKKENIAKWPSLSRSAYIAINKEVKKVSR